MYECQVLPDKRLVTFEGEMTIYTAAELKEKFDEAIEDPLELEIDLAKVNEIDSAGIQLLMLAKKSRQAKQYGLHLVALSDDVHNAFEAMGLNCYFGESAQSADE